jgi:hypothetical protein
MYRLKDQNKTLIYLPEKSDHKNPKYPEALFIKGNPHNDDLLLDYLKEGKSLTQEIIYGHMISRVSVEFM